MPIPAAEFSMIEEPVVVIRDFLKNHEEYAWSAEEISENTGLDITTVYHICQLMRAKYVEASAIGEYFPIRSIERLGQAYFIWVPKPRRTRKKKSEVKS